MKFQINFPHSALRIPHSALLFALLLFTTLAAPAQTNNLRPVTSALMTDTNGVLVAPANFFRTNAALLNAAVTNAVTNLNAANLAGVVSPPHGGLGFANTNVVPAGAVFDNGVTYGNTAYVVNVVSNQTYYVLYPNGNAAGDVVYYGAGWESFAEPFAPASGEFVAGTNRVVIYGGGNPGDPVTTQIWPVTPGLFGNLGGAFAGTLAADSTIPTAVIQAAGAQLRGAGLYAVANGGAENWIISTNTANESTLSLGRAGTNGFADVNFFTYTYSTNFIPPQSPKLWFAIGIGSTAASQFPYNQPYLESYLNDNAIYYVGANQIFGGFYSTPATHDGDWVWFQDGTTNTPMFRINRASKTITNYYPVVCAGNLTFSAPGKGLTAPLYTPASSSETNFVGALRWDANYLYVWTATNVNKRVALSAW